MKKNNHIKIHWLSIDTVEVWLDRPKSRNAYSEMMLTELLDVLVHLKKHKKLKICLIRGSGEDFCAGGDLKAMLAQSDLFQGPRKKLSSTYKKYIQKLSLTLNDVNFLTIALVQGGAIGAGVGLALACDLIWCTGNAYFRLPFFNLALVPADGSFWRLEKKIGYTKTLGFLLRDTKINSKQAIELGIIDKLLSTFDDKQIRESLAELKTQLFAKSDWSKIIIMLRTAPHLSLKSHLHQMRAIQSKLQLQKEHLQVVRSIVK